MGCTPVSVCPCVWDWDCIVFEAGSEGFEEHSGRQWWHAHCSELEFQLFPHESDHMQCVPSDQTWHGRGRCCGLPHQTHKISLCEEKPLMKLFMKAHRKNKETRQVDEMTWGKKRDENKSGKREERWEQVRWDEMSRNYILQEVRRVEKRRRKKKKKRQENVRMFLCFRELAGLEVSLLRSWQDENYNSFSIGFI